MPVTFAPCSRAAWMANAPQPEPMSSTRSPSFSLSLAHTSSFFTTWASSSVFAPREKIAQL